MALFCPFNIFHIEKCRHSSGSGRKAAYRNKTDSADIRAKSSMKNGMKKAPKQPVQLPIGLKSLYT